MTFCAFVVTMEALVQMWAPILSRIARKKTDEHFYVDKLAMIFLFLYQR